MRAYSQTFIVMRVTALRVFTAPLFRQRSYIYKRSPRRTAM